MSGEGLTGGSSCRGLTRVYACLYAHQVELLLRAAPAKAWLAQAHSGPKCQVHRLGVHSHDPTFTETSSRLLRVPNAFRCVLASLAMTARFLWVQPSKYLTSHLKSVQTTVPCSTRVFICLGHGEAAGGVKRGRWVKDVLQQEERAQRGTVSSTLVQTGMKSGESRCRNLGEPGKGWGVLGMFAHTDTWHTCRGGQAESRTLQKARPVSHQPCEGGLSQKEAWM